MLRRRTLYGRAAKMEEESFVEEVISERPFEPSGTVFFGDYLNIAAVDNVVRPCLAQNGQR